MFEQTFSVAADVPIEVSGQDDVVIRGWERPTVHFIARGAPSGVQVEQQEGRLRLSSQDDCTLEVPCGARLTIAHVSGDLEISGVHGEIILAEVLGDVCLRHVGTVQVRHIGGDLEGHELASLESPGEIRGDVWLRGVSGALTLACVGGDVEASNVGGNVQLATIQGDLTLKRVGGATSVQMVQGDACLTDMAGGVTIANAQGEVEAKNLPGGVQIVQAQGDVEITTALTAGQTYAVEGKSDIDLYVVGEPSAKVSLRSDDGEVASDWALSVAASGESSGTLGDGAATLTLLSHGGDVTMHRVAGEPHAQRHEEWHRTWTAGDIDRLVDREMRRAMQHVEKIDFEAVGRQVETAVQQAMVGVDFEKIGRQVDETIHQAMHRYDEASSRPPFREVRRDDASEEQAARHAERRGEPPAPPPPPPPAQPAPPPPPPAQAAVPTGPGTMDILRAVERGEMSVDEALKRLSGNQ
jgi:hypothetical protein